MPSTESIVRRRRWSDFAFSAARRRRLGEEFKEFKELEEFDQFRRRNTGAQDVGVQKCRIDMANEPAKDS